MLLKSPPKASPLVDNPEMMKCSNNQHLLGTYYVPGTSPTCLHVGAHLFFMLPCEENISIAPLYERKDETLERLSNYSKITQLSDGGIQRRAV